VTETASTAFDQGPNPNNLREPGPPADRRGSWLPSPAMIGTKLLELRKRRALMITTLVFTVGMPVAVIGVRELFHLFDPRSYGPATDPGIFVDLCGVMASFGFIIAAAFGATAGTTDLTDGVFRHLVITGRSRLALYLARIPAGLAILLTLTGAGFAIVCLATVYLGVAQPTSVDESGVDVPVHLDQARLEDWLQQHAKQGATAFGFVGDNPVSSPAAFEQALGQNIATIYREYVSDEAQTLDPGPGQMTDAGLWLELDATIAYTVGLGFGCLIGQRTVATISMIVLEVIITPMLAKADIPHFVNVQRLLVGAVMDQLRPAVLGSAIGTGGPGSTLVGNVGPGQPGLTPTPGWAMAAIIGGWIIGWSVIGARRMMTRDA
jgi:hypothetical protein